MKKKTLFTFPVIVAMTLSSCMFANPSYDEQ